MSKNSHTNVKNVIRMLVIRNISLYALFSPTLLIFLRRCIFALIKMILPVLLPDFALFNMTLLKKKYYLLSGISAGIISVIILQAVWMHYAYMQTRQQLIVHIGEAFEQAYIKEQTYRIPVVDIVNPGAVTIESCGTEEIQIIRKCSMPDTVVYKNPSGHSIENFIRRVFMDLREHIVPMNINCLADLFAGMLHEKNIPAYFVIERFNVTTGEVLDTSLLPDKKQPAMNPETTLLLEISEKESLRAIIKITPGMVLAQMAETLTLTVVLIFVVASCLIFVYCHNLSIGRFVNAERSDIKETEKLVDVMPESSSNVNTVFDKIFNIGQYVFDPAKNDLHGYGESVQLNKKENSILYALCTQYGNVVERAFLLSENWGNTGVIYSRSLDTYIATLRKYLKKDSSIQIVTIKGVGYKIVC